MRTIRQRVRVLPGGRIEITDPSLQEGTEADVTVSVPEGDGAAPALQGGGATRMLTYEELEGLPPAPVRPGHRRRSLESYRRGG